jgi:hypothetical protein
MGRFRPTNNDATLDWARPYLESEYVKVVWTTTHAAQIEVDAAAGVLAGLAAVAWRRQRCSPDHPCLSSELDTPLPSMDVTILLSSNPTESSLLCTCTAHSGVNFA